jgi:shikimate kinase
MKPQHNIVLIGFMGSGKTSIGKRLSIKMKWEFVDMDDFIEKREGMTINEIFETKGEPYFRDIERELCIRFSEPRCKIIATGGGVIKNAKNVAALKQGGVIVYLKTNAETVAYNLRNDDTRPLLRCEDKLGKIRELLAQREPTYKKCADITIDVSHLNLEDTLNKITEEYEKYENKRCKWTKH